MFSSARAGMAWNTTKASGHSSLAVLNCEIERGLRDRHHDIDAQPLIFLDKQGQILRLVLLPVEALRIQRLGKIYEAPRRIFGKRFAHRGVDHQIRREIGIRGVEDQDAGFRFEPRAAATPACPRQSAMTSRREPTLALFIAAFPTSAAATRDKRLLPTASRIVCAANVSHTPVPPSIARDPHYAGPSRSGRRGRAR